MVELRCTLFIRVGGKLVRGSESKYLNGIIAETKVDPNSFSFYELMDTIRQMGYGVTYSNGVTEHVTGFYKLPMHDMNDGLVNLTSHYEVEMFAMKTSIARRVGLPLPQGWRRSTKIRNVIFWSQPAGSSVASCGSGSTTGNATMPSTGPKQLSQAVCRSLTLENQL